MTADAWLTALVLVVVVIALVATKITPDLILLTGLAGLLTTGVLDPTEAVAGFANPAVVTVGVLYVVSAGLRETGAMESITARVLGPAGSERAARSRLVLPVAVGSAFVSNTPIVAMLMPALGDWARRARISPRALLMPLSFAAILGGMCSLIGTSTNLVVHALLLSHPQGGADGLGMFTIAWVGLPAAAVGLLYIVFVAPRPRREDVEGSDGADAPREYATAMRVATYSPAIGRTIEGAGLRRLPGLYLMRIERGDEVIVAASSAQVLREGDVLVFVGALESVVDLRRLRGLEPVTDGEAARGGTERTRPGLVEAVVAPTARFLGTTVREAAFRSRYGAAIVAVSRHGERLQGKIGDIALQVGDAVLLEARKEFLTRIRGARDFYLASEIPGGAAPRHALARVALAILVAMIVAMSLLPAHTMTVALMAALAMVLMRCCTGGEARTAVNLQVMIVIGAAFGLGVAMEKTGLAQEIAAPLVRGSAVFGLVGVLGAVYLTTAALTQLITNNAAAILMFPIVAVVSQTEEIALLPLAICVAIAASAGFATPVGYHTNLMVLGPGGYKTRDFARVGLPLVLIVGLVAVGMLAGVQPFPIHR